MTFKGNEMSRAKFRARIIVEDGDTQEIEIWDDELSPFGKDGKCSIREWVKMHFDNFSNDDLRDLLGVPPEGNYEGLVEGTIIGTTSYYGEYNEHVEINNSMTQQIPDEWYQPPY